MPNEKLMQQPRPRRFQLVRHEDVNGASGTGVVAEGIEFRDGMVAYRWTTRPATTQIAPSINDVRHIHGHNGKTTVRWLDDPGPPGPKQTVQELHEMRALLALAFCELAYSHPSPAMTGGWYPDEGDDADADEWAVAWAVVAGRLLCWSVQRQLAEASSLVEYGPDDELPTPSDVRERLVASITDPS